jgi:hypothetical protein
MLPGGAQSAVEDRPDLSAWVDLSGLAGPVEPVSETQALAILKGISAKLDVVVQRWEHDAYGRRNTLPRLQQVQQTR